MPRWDVQIEDITETVRLAEMQETEDVLVPDPVVLHTYRTGDRDLAVELVESFEDDMCHVHVLSRVYTDDELDLTFLGSPCLGAGQRMYHCYATCL